MNIFGLAAILLIVVGALLSPFVLAWAAYCLTRSSHRVEGATILATGLLVAGSIVLVSALNAPPNAPGLFRVQALVIIAGYFGFGAVLGKALHFIVSRREATRQ